MPILNYTTEVDAAKTVGEIERILVSHGARNINKNYDANGQIESLSFIVMVGKTELPVRLPVDPDAVHAVLVNQGVQSQKYLSREQSVRVAWRIAKDWVAAQMALYEAKQVKMEQVFLPYIVTPTGQTVYEVIAEKGFLQLSSREGGQA